MCLNCSSCPCDYFSDYPDELDIMLEEFLNSPPDPNYIKNYAPNLSFLPLLDEE